ncbi:MAG: D-alanyl-D-alanine carboxypeptidase family protein [Methyloligellaceae bacterium]
MSGWRTLGFQSVGLMAAALGLMVFASGGTPAAEFDTKADFAILVDADSKSVLFEKNADEFMAPASMSKLATLAVIFQGLKTGRFKMEDEFHISENAWRTGGAPSGTSAMFAPLNSSVKLLDLLQGIVVQSGNDACIAIAEGVSGSELAFAEEMTRYVRKIGLKKSTFRNSTGLPDPEHLMTARELAMLSQHIIKDYPEYYPYFKQKEFRYRRHRFFNRNPLIYLNLGVDGLKTGYIKDSGYGLVASGEKNGRRLIVVVNGLKSKKTRTAEARRLLEWGYRNFRPYKLFDGDETVGEARVWGGTSMYIRLVGKGDVRVYLPRFDKKKLKASIVYDGPLKPPIKEGDQVARLRVVADNSATSEVPLYAAEDVGRGGVMRRGFDSFLYLTFGWLL